MTRERVLAFMEQEIFRYDRERDGLTREDVDRFDQRKSASERAGHISYVMRHDLDGDGRVTREEALRQEHFSARLKPSQVPDDRLARRIEKSVGYLMRADANGDNIITFDEMRTNPKGGAIPDRYNFMNKLFELDPNHNERLTRADMKQLINEAFRRYEIERPDQVR